MGYVDVPQNIYIHVHVSPVILWCYYWSSSDLARYDITSTFCVPALITHKSEIGALLRWHFRKNASLNRRIGFGIVEYGSEPLGQNCSTVVHATK